jgi:hypothetical protein
MNYCIKYALISLIFLLPFSEASSQSFTIRDNEISVPGITSKVVINNNSSFSEKSKKLSEFKLYPVAGYTFNSGFLPGMFLTNQVDSLKRFAFQVMPMYAWKQQNIIGEGKFSYNKMNSSGKIKHFKAFVSGRSYFFRSSNDFDFRAWRVETGIQITFHNPEGKNELINTFSAKLHHSKQDILSYMMVDSTYIPTKDTRTLNALRLNWTYDFRRAENPIGYEFNTDISDEFARVQGIFHGKLNYDSPKKFFEYRFYAGAYIFKKNSFQNDFDGRLGISGITSEQDIFIDHWFLGRNYATHHMSDQQTYIDQGGFYTNMISGKSWDWASALTFKTTMPFDAPFQLYLGIGAFPNYINNKVQTAYEGGILIAPFPGVLEIAFPILLDPKSLETLNLNTNNYLEKIRFILNFEKINLYKWSDHPKIPKPWL